MENPVVSTSVELALPDGTIGGKFEVSSVSVTKRGAVSPKPIVNRGRDYDVVYTKGVTEKKYALDAALLEAFFVGPSTLPLTVTATTKTQPHPKLILSSNEVEITVKIEYTHEAGPSSPSRAAAFLQHQQQLQQLWQQNQHQQETSASDPMLISGHPVHVTQASGAESAAAHILTETIHQIQAEAAFPRATGIPHNILSPSGRRPIRASPEGGSSAARRQGPPSRDISVVIRHDPDHEDVRARASSSLLRPGGAAASPRAHDEVEPQPVSKKSAQAASSTPAPSLHVSIDRSKLLHSAGARGENGGAGGSRGGQMRGHGSDHDNSSNMDDLSSPSQSSSVGSSSPYGRGSGGSLPHVGVVSTNHRGVVMIDREKLLRQRGD
eukprot:jgi/Mesvir1/28992/Mv17762-RA.1